GGDRIQRTMSNKSLSEGTGSPSEAKNDRANRRKLAEKATVFSIHAGTWYPFISALPRFYTFGWLKLTVLKRRRQASQLHLTGQFRLLSVPRQGYLCHEVPSRGKPRLFRTPPLP